MSTVDLIWCPFMYAVPGNFFCGLHTCTRMLLETYLSKGRSKQRRSLNFCSLRNRIQEFQVCLSLFKVSVSIRHSPLESIQ